MNYKITIKASPMSETPKGTFRYVYRMGQIGEPLDQSNFSNITNSAIGWIPVAAHIEEIITPGWCEYKDINSDNIICLWRNSEGMTFTMKNDSEYINDLWVFHKQITFEPQEEEA